MKLQHRFPHNDENIPEDKQLPDGLGLPVRVHYEGEPVGRVVGWEAHGDGTATADIEIPDVLNDGTPLQFGLDGRARVRRQEDGQLVVESIPKLAGVGVWPEGTRPSEQFSDFPEGPADG